MKGGLPMVQKQLNPNDIARLFAEDVKRYVDIVKSTVDLSATNVYNLLSGYEQEDSFKESLKVIEKANEFRTEFARDRYFLVTIDIHEKILKLDNESLKSIRKQICDQANIEDWDEKSLARNAFLVMNLSIMKNRDYLKGFEGETEREKYIHLIFNKYLEVMANEKQ